MLVFGDRFVGLAFLDEGDAEVVVGVGVIGIEAEGILELADGLVRLAFLVEDSAEVVVREPIVFRDVEGMPEQALTVFPMPELLPGHRKAEENCR